MDEMELNKKLAEWAGFKQVPRYGGTDMSLTLWRAPDGNHDYTPPDFTQSLDACFKWLMPKSVECLRHSRNWDEKGAIHHIFRSWLREYWKGKGVHSLALALCLAIEKLIDRGE